MQNGASGVKWGDKDDDGNEFEARGFIVDEGNGRCYCDGQDSAKCEKVTDSQYMRYVSWKRAAMFSGWVVFLISLGSTHVRPMGHTRGELNEIELAGSP